MSTTNDTPALDSDTPSKAGDATERLDPVAPSDASVGGDDTVADSGDTTALTAIAATGDAGRDGDDPTDQRPAWRRWAPAWGGLLVLILAAGAWVGWMMWDRQAAALPGVTIDGVDVAGMDEAALSELLQAREQAAQDATITATAADQAFTMSLGEDGYQADVPAAVDQALAAGRDGPWGSVVSHVEASFGRTWELSLATETFSEPVAAYVADIAETIHVEPFNGVVRVRARDAQVLTRDPETGIELVADEALAMVSAVAGTGQDADLDLPTNVLQPRTTSADVASARRALRSALSEPYVLDFGDDAITIPPTEFARFLDIAGPARAFAVSLDRGSLRSAMEGRGDRFNQSAVSAQYRIESGWRTYDNKGSGTWDPSAATVSIIEGQNGREYDHRKATRQVVQLWEAGEHADDLDITITEPRLSNDNAQKWRPNALLGTFTTYDACCDNRQHNIRLLTDLIDGTMLLPGEDFSVNDDIGPRTASLGFLPAGAIVGGEIDEDNVGGGISQTATTFYNAAFFAGIEVLQHRPHSWPISRYPLAREATFDYGSDLDIHIRNNTQGAIIVDTSWAGESVTYNIFGVDDGRTVTAEMGSPYNYTNFTTIRRGTSDLYVGQERVVQSGAQGFSVNYRQIISGGTTPGTKSLSWTYSPKDTIIEYGTTPRPAAAPPSNGGGGN